MENRTIYAFENAITKMKERNWDRIYIFVDLHETLLKPTWDKDVLATEFYDDSIEAMKLMSDNPALKLVMYTSSPKKDIEVYKDLCRTHGINFDFVNINTEVTSNDYGDYSEKPYMNVLIDDKAGFIPTIDWTSLITYLNYLKL